MPDQLIQLIDNRTGAAAAPPVAPPVPVVPPLDLATVRERLATGSGREYWRSLEELADDEQFTDFLRREFPMQAPRDMAPLKRRDFLKLMGAALALAGVSGCAFQPQEKIVPYVKAPEDQVAGVPLFYATACQLGGYAMGLLAESHMGRPTKLEGNPDHPSSLGATDVFAQAAILSLYDPDRSQAVRKGADVSTWGDFLGAVQARIDGRDGRTGLKATAGRGLHILTESITSPTLIAQLQQVLKRFPQAKWHSYEPINRDNVFEGAKKAFGQVVEPVYHFDKADVIVSLDSDFFSDEPGRVRYAKDFSARRKYWTQETAGQGMNRLYSLESSPTITGARADNRFPLRPSQIIEVARYIAKEVGAAGAGSGEANLPTAAVTTPALPTFVKSLVDDLKANRGKGLVIAGAQQPPAVHAMAHAINAVLGNSGVTVEYLEPIQGNVGRSQVASMQELVRAINAREVDTLVILGGNPVYNAPADLKFKDAFAPGIDNDLIVKGTEKVPLRIHLGHYVDETAVWCNWHVPEAHFLEAWGDTRGHDGTVSLVQPLIAPLYPEAHSALDVVGAFNGQANQTSYDIVRAHWAGPRPAANFEKNWQTWLHDGTIPNTAAVRRPVAPTGLYGSVLIAEVGKTPESSNGLEVSFRPDPTTWDGRFANNAWLQELPKPLTKLTWDNAVLINPNTAEKLGLATEDKVSLTANGASVDAWVLLVAGHPVDALTVHLGYGRERAGKVGTRTGFNGYTLRTAAGDIVTGAKLAKQGGRYPLAKTEHHNLVDKGTKLIDRLQNNTPDTHVDGTHGRELFYTFNYNDVSHASPAEATAHFHKEISDEIREKLPLMSGIEMVDKKPVFMKKSAREMHQDDKTEDKSSLYARHVDTAGQYNSPELNKADARDTKSVTPYAWGMLIDINTCIGCNACVIACQAENNSAVTGKDQVLMSREMHWLRIDTYFQGDMNNPGVTFQPVACMHCEKAPCEPVCPVEATAHSPEGLNNMTYNRCIGTRYCSNNCPYKVRRFNFLQYSDQETPTITLMANPDVTVRSRGVMEKCTYCVQRINSAKFQAEREERSVREGDIVTACQQVCPSNAIVFGNINDVKSKIYELKHEPHHFGMLTELNTLPRTTYLAKFDNPHPDLVSSSKEGHGKENHHG